MPSGVRWLDTAFTARGLTRACLEVSNGLGLVLEEFRKIEHEGEAEAEEEWERAVSP